MNRSGELIDYLSRTRDCGRVIIAPNAPPVTRQGRELTVALTRVLDASDVADTLMALRERAAGGEGELGDVGQFSFGLRDVGRFRVHYLTQRGSRVISITRIPFASEDIETVCSTPQALKPLLDNLESGQQGIVVIGGTSDAANSRLGYAILRSINLASRHVLYVIERELTYLMSHENSIVIQSELGSDAATFAEALEGAMRFAPDVVYMGGAGEPADILPAARASHAGIFVIVSSSRVAMEDMTGPFALPVLHTSLKVRQPFRLAVLVDSDCDEQGRLRIRVEP
jgi:twitching motility protein PilT